MAFVLNEAIFLFDATQSLVPSFPSLPRRRDSKPEHSAHCALMNLKRASLQGDQHQFCLSLKFSEKTGEILGIASLTVGPSVRAV